ADGFLPQGDRRMSDWRANILEDDDAIRSLLEAVRRIAVLGIKPESRESKPAFYVPAYLQRAGFEIVPVPVHYPDVDEILGERVYRNVAEIPGPVDLVDVFRKPGDIPQHVPDIAAKKPAAVWFQSGIRNDEAAE